MTETKSEQKNEKKFAWVTLVMIGDAYIPGALVLAHSLRRANTKYDIAIMVTKDVSVKAVLALKTVFTHVIEVPYITKPTAYPRSEKQKKIYSWVDKSLTKWNCLKFTQWSRVIFLDADICITRNMDELFDLVAPAGCFSSPWAYPYTEGRGIMNPYLDWYRRQDPKNKDAHAIPTGTVFPARFLMSVFRKPSFTLLGAVVLLETSESEFAELMATVNIDNPNFMYGKDHKLVANTAEEAAIVDSTASRGIDWTHINQRFEAVPRKPLWTRGVSDDKLMSYHYLGAHPWAMDRHAWPDLARWWEEADAIEKNFPELTPWFRLVKTDDAKSIKKDDEKTDISISASPKSDQIPTMNPVDTPKN